MAKHTYTSDTGFCNSSAVPPSSGKGSPCWFINLGNQMPLADLVSKHANLRSGLVQLHMASRASQRLLSTFPISQTLQRQMTKSKLWPRLPYQWPPASGLASVGPRDLGVSIPSHTQIHSPARPSALVNISVLFPGNRGLWSTELTTVLVSGHPQCQQRESINLKLDIFHFSFYWRLF